MMKLYYSIGQDQGKQGKDEVAYCIVTFLGFKALSFPFLIES